jgi:hypothetical protein
MPKPKLSNIGPALPGDPDGIENFNKVVDFYHVVWGLNPNDAVQQATEDFNRGPNNKIYAGRVQQASDWKERQDAYAERVAARTPQGSGDVPAQPYNPVTNPYGAGAPEPVTGPELYMANPRLVDPKAWAEQDKLNARRAGNPASAPLPPALPPTPAAITPQHLDDATLSTWQQLANMIGYSTPNSEIRRR